MNSDEYLFCDECGSELFPEGAYVVSNRAYADAECDCGSEYEIEYNAVDSVRAN